MANFKAFWRGFWSIFSLGSSSPRKISLSLPQRSPEEALAHDAAAIASDWAAVGNDLRTAIHKIVQFSFCETETATATSPWHIRILTTQGKKLGGGADSLALCQRKVAWDLATPITEHHLQHCCQTCAAKYRDLRNA